MPEKKGSTSRRRAAPRSVSLKELARRLDLSPTTLSLVLNQSPGAKAIPQETKDRIFAAARGLNYHPNFLARSLRSRRTYSVGVLLPEFSDGYSALVLSGIEDFLLGEGYIYLVTTHRHKPELIECYPKLLRERCVEGIIAVDTPYEEGLALPVVSVSGHKDVPGVTNIVLDHDKAAELGLSHLLELGHRHVAVFKGQSFSSDTEVRWQAIRAVATRLGIPISPSLVVQLESESPSPEVGYLAAKKLLAAREPFTALFAFNDVSAFGAIRAFREADWRVPQDISVIGFDDVSEAAFHNPALTTVRQPLCQMGSLAAQTLLQRIAAGSDSQYPKVLQVEPELVVRESTAQAPARATKGGSRARAPAAMGSRCPPSC